MRFSVSLEPDLYAIVRALARERDISLSRALNELVRRGLEPRPSKGSREKGDGGLPVVRGRRAFTSEDVYRIDLEAS